MPEIECKKDSNITAIFLANGLSFSTEQTPMNNNELQTESLDSFHLPHQIVYSVRRNASVKQEFTDTQFHRHTAYDLTQPFFFRNVNIKK